MKIVIAGGTGHLGAILVQSFQKQGHDVVVLSRGGQSQARLVHWDGQKVGPWSKEIDGCDVVVNLAGRTVNCRYTEKNLGEMMTSRVQSTEAVGKSIVKAKKPPKLWLQMSTATIYAHRVDKGNTEKDGLIGGEEPGVPALWARSIAIAKAWEQKQQDMATPKTRKIALRTSMVMATTPHGVFDTLRSLAILGLGGAIAGGQQYVSWLHEADFVRAVTFLMEVPALSGAINLCSPYPLPQKHFMAELREAIPVPVGFPASRWMVEMGAFFMRTESELLLKSRYVLPRRLLDAGFTFTYPVWREAVRELLQRHQA